MKSHRLTVARIVVPLLLSLAAPWVNAATPRADYTATDRLIVRFKDTSASAAPIQLPGKASPQSASSARLSPSDQANQRQQVARRLQRLTTETLAPMRTMADGAHIIRLSRRLPLHEINTIAKLLAKDPEVLEVLPDRLFFPAATPPPTDPQYANQWNLTQANGINIQGAWDITTGSSSLVIAILDTGILPHADLTGRILPGYDFIANTDKPRSNDVEGINNGRDPNPADTGDALSAGEAASGLLAGCPVVTESSWHGTAMAGVIAANANNGTGIAGINWNSKILPVRVMGKCGGYESDIAEGLLWAVGLYSTQDIAINPNIAQVINMSLTTAGQGVGNVCSSVLQNAITAAINAGVPVIAAAGNQGQDASGYSPGNCSGVITVGAVDKNGGKPTYTNTGSTVTISAPGGFDTNPGTTLNAPGTDTRPETSQVWTTSDSGTSGPANDSVYKTTFGTSVATAQVTGVVSLMRSVNPALSPAIIKEILQNTSRTFPTNTAVIMPNPSQADCTNMLCGVGISNGGAALRAVQLSPIPSRKIEGGWNHVLGLSSDGTLFTWGAGSSGQLGNGSVYQGSSIPLRLSTFAGVVDVASGFQNSLAIRAGGSVWSWGLNNYGQLGDGTTTDRSLPVQALTTGVFTQVATGYPYSLARKEDGTVWSWGRNHLGQLGDGTTTDRLLPALVPGLTNVVAIAKHKGGPPIAAVLKGDGTVWRWGDTVCGAIATSTPTQLAGFVNVTAIATGEENLLALRNDGTVWACDSGVTVPFQVPGLSNVVSIAVTKTASLALKSDGTLWAWGVSSNGEFGDGSFGSRTTPGQVPGLSGLSAIGTGQYNVFAIKSDGSVFAWGLSNGGEIGAGQPFVVNATHTPFPTQVLSPTGDSLLGLNAYAFFAKLNVSRSSVFTSNAVTINGIAAGTTLSVSGGDYSLGCNGTFTSASASVSNSITVCLRQTSSANVPITTTTATLTLSGGTNLSSAFSVTTVAGDVTPNSFSFTSQTDVALNATIVSNTVSVTGINLPVEISITDGSYSIGCNGTFVSSAGTVINGQTVCVRHTTAATSGGSVTTTLTIAGISASFVSTTSLTQGPITTTSKIEGGWNHVLGLSSDGTLFTWGAGSSGQLGNGSVYQGSSIPLRLSTFAGVVDVASGFQNSLAIRAGGSVWSWGLNNYGQLGDGTTTDRSLPVQALTTGVFTQVATGYPYSLARKEDGTVWSWGRNHLGQLGDGTTTDRLLPALVPGLTNVVAIAKHKGGPPIAAVLKGDGTVWRWGDTVCGAIATSTPTQLAGFVNVTAIATGEENLLALRNDGTVWACDSGVTVPFQVPGLSNVVSIAVTKTASLALKSDGTLWAWGVSSNGEFGDGSFGSRTTPGQVPGLSGLSAIGTGQYNVFAIKSDGSVFAWGLSNGGEIGAGQPFVVNATHTPFPTQVLSPTGDSLLGLNAYAFFAKLNVSRSSVFTSNAVTINGIAAGTTLSVSGGDYSLGCNGTFTSASASVSNSITVCLRQTSSANVPITTTTATLTLSGGTNLSSAFSVTTVAGDVTPNSFSFTSQTDVALNATIVSNTVSVTGINLPVEISITDGSYSIGCNGTFVSSAGTVINGQTVCVRHTTAATSGGSVTTTLTIAGISASFVSTTSLTQGPITTTSKIEGGWNHVLGLSSDGTLFTWGAGSSGQLGNGSVYQGSSIPLRLSTFAGVVDVASGFQNSLAIRAGGSVWSWGLNNYGQLGDGTTTDRSLPVQALTTGVFTQVATGYPYSLARKEDGTVWSWGRNHLGQLGDGTTTDRLLPALVPGLTNVVAIAKHKGGPPIAAVLKGDGTVWRWGDTVCGAIATSTPTQLAGFVNVTAIATGEENLLALRNDGTVWACDSGVTVPFQVPGLSNVVSIAVTKTASLALKSDGTLWAWGVSSNGEFGDGSFGSRTTPGQVPGLSGLSAIGTGQYNVFAIKSDGSVFAWGLSNGGEIGAGQPFVVNATHTPFPTQVLSPTGDDFLYLYFNDTIPRPFAFLPGVHALPSSLVVSNAVTITSINASSPVSVLGGDYSIGCTGVYTSAAGAVANNQTICVRVLSAPTFDTTNSATLTVGAAGAFSGQSSSFLVRTRRDLSVAAVVPQVVLGNSHSYLLNLDATVYAVGYNGNGQLGNGTTLGTSVLRPVAGLAKTVALASGANHALALRSDGNVAAWGYNASGQLGHSLNVISESYFVNVASLTNVAAISAGDYHSLALKQDGTVWAWGLNVDGQIGQGNITTSRYLTPIQVPGLSGVTAIAAGGRHNLAVLANGSVVAWGSNTSGQLGDGTLVSRSSPVPVTSLSSGVLSVYAGGAHSLALKTDSTAVAWGNNDFGQLGDGSNTTRTSPVAISSLGTGVALLAAGTSHSLAVKVGGVLFSWGANTNSQLGDNALVNRNTPFQFTTITNVVAIAAGGRHSAALTRQKKLNIFGDNYFGQVGSKSGNYNPHSGSLNILRGDSQISQGIAAASSSIGTSGFSGSALLELSGIAAGIFFPRTAVADSAITIGTFTNTSSADTYPSISVTLPTGAPFFALTDNQCTAQIIPGGQCTFQITFAPTAATAYGGSVKVTSPAGEQSLSLTGDGQANGPVLSLPGLPPDQSTLLFESVQLGGQSDTQSIVVKNEGDPALTLNPIASPSDFQITANSCDPALAPSGIAPNGTCQIDVRFSPNGQGLFSAGTRSAVLTLTSNGGSRTVTLSGTAVYSANDTVPDGFTDFASQPGVATNTERTSLSQTITGINAPAQISIANGSYSINCTGTFTNQPGSISNGQTVCVRHNSAASASSTVTTTLTIGGVSGSFSSTTGTGVTAPSAPVLNSITQGPGRATLNFSAPSNNGGSAITSYTATCTAPGQVTRTATGSGSPLTVVGLTAGVAYTCSLTATNGAGLTSGASGILSVTPATMNKGIAPLLMYLLD